ncbi:hypothetical protein EMCRGX_G026007 [Ephydatia muelleri]
MAWRMASVSLILTIVFTIANVEAGLTHSQKMQFLNAHNSLRRSVRPPARNMKTMVVWADSDRLGCGVARCASLRNLPSFRNVLNVVCNYGPGGNIVGQRPYSTTRKRSSVKTIEDGGELFQETDGFVDSDENELLAI